MRHIFIINPTAGRRDNSASVVKNIEKVCKARGLEYDIYLTAHPKHATEIVIHSARKFEGKLRFYACGGDGTLNEVAAGAAEAGENCSFTSIPIGTGNDYVKLFEGGREAFLDLDRLIDGTEIDIDYIRSDCGCSINVLSVGIDAEVARGKGKYKMFGNGLLPYAASAVECVIRGIGKEYYINIDGEQLDGNYTLVFIGNGRFYGGGFCPVPCSKIGDGLLDVLLVKKVSRLEAAALVSKYISGRYKELSQYITYKQAKEIKIFSKSNEDMCINLDGEVVESRHISMRIEPQKLRFVIPKGSSVLE